MTVALFTVVVCTRDRAQHLPTTLDALEGQPQDFPILVVEQSMQEDAALHQRAASNGRLRVLRDTGQGLSRARNLAWPQVETEWVVFVDDDCVVDERWGAELGAVLASRGDVDFVSGHVGLPGHAGPQQVPVTCFRVERERVRSGRWTRPWAIGFGVCMAVRRSAIERLGGWDERLGAGTSDFPAAEDMDFNFRLLRSGGAALATPRVRAEHRQWRTRAELPPLLAGYMAGWCGFAMKTLQTTSVVAGLWLWGAALLDLGRTMVAVVRRRSRLHLTLVRHKLPAVARGTWRGLRRSW
ncbi:MAG: glycosyltransferase [Actinomycetota bacterium]|nr:glycosyltransferase [Actinomycetota bacterium]